MRKFQFCSGIETKFCSGMETNVVTVRLLVVCFLVFLTVHSSPLAHWKRNTMPSTHSKCVALESPSGRPVVPSKVSNESAPRAATARHSVVETATTRYCELGRGRSKATVFDQCHQLLHPIVNQPGGNHRQNWLLFGDSTVARIVSSTRRCATSNETFRYRCDHCKLLTSTESIRVQNWKKPNATLGEGPRVPTVLGAILKSYSRRIRKRKTYWSRGSSTFQWSLPGM